VRGVDTKVGGRGDACVPLPVWGRPVRGGVGMCVPSYNFTHITDGKQYDWIAFLPGLLERLVNARVYNMDNAQFPDLWQANTAQFLRIEQGYLRSRDRWACGTMREGGAGSD